MFSSALPPLVYVLVVFILTIPLCLIAYWKKVLSWDGAAVALSIGIIIGFFGGILWFLLIFILLLSSFIATKYKFEAKKAMGLQEGKQGERGSINVIVHGALPCIIAVLNFMYDTMKVSVPFFNERTATILFITTISAAGADTIASEIGVLSDKVRLITNYKKVKPGTNGGVSVLGTVSALGAAAYISVLGWYVLSLQSVTLVNVPQIMLIPLTAGFLGCNIDSVIGATLETKGYLGKHTNNLISMTCAVIIAFGVLTWLKM